MRMRATVLSLAACAALAACGSPPATSSSSATPHVTPRPTPTPGPDTETVTVSATGVGAFDLVAVPVAVLHNDARRHGAHQVVVHFSTAGAGGAAEGSLDSVPVNLAPGETLAVTANCTDACNDAASARASVTVTAWVLTSGATLAASPATFQCQSCGPGHGHGNVTGTLTARLGGGAAVSVFAYCETSPGSIVGGGSQPLVWPGGGSLQVEVAVIISAPPSACHLGASTGW